MVKPVAAVASDDIHFEYDFVPIGELQVEMTTDKKTGKEKVDHVLVSGEKLKPTDRFWISLFARYGFNNAFFNYFDHAEVFNRISERESNDKMRICIERGTKQSRLLAVSNPAKPLVGYDDFTDLISRYGGENVTYADGVVESVHTPRNGGGMTIGADDFQHRFTMSCPIDGYGAPNVYLSLLRMLCTNGIVGYSKAFRTSLSLGKASDDVAPSMIRVLEGFSNDEGYAAIRQRIESSQKSWASVYESDSLQKMLIKLHSKRYVDDLNKVDLAAGSVRDWYAKASNHFDSSVADENDSYRSSPIFRAYEEMTGNPVRMYGIANLDALSAKRQRTLPAKCKVYDIINFATEVATHYSTPEASRQIQGFVGNLISGEYDMEGTVDKFTEFDDFHISDDDGRGIPTVGDESEVRELATV